jgi:pentatricopeptide repeat protein
LADDADHDVKREDFLVVLRLLVEAAATPGAAVRAERWLGRLEKLAVAHDDDDELASALRPTTECYRLVIATWASAKRESPQIIVARAERWLNKGLDSAVEEQQPDTATWNAFLDAVSKGRAHKGAKALTTVRDHAIQAQETLERMLEDQRQHGSGSRMAPDTDSFNYVMRAWTRCRRATDIADRTMDALRALEDYQRRVDPNVGPNTKSYGMVLDSLSCRAMQKVKAFAHQNHQHANSPSPDSYRPGDATDTAENGLDEMEMMEGVLAHMLQHQQRQGSRVAMQATTFLYNTIITAWAHLSRVHEHGPSAAERVLQLMTRYADEGKTAVKPDALSYQLVMRAWNNSGLPHRAQRAAWWLSTQWQDYEFDGDLQRRPTTKCYNAVIRVFADTGEPVKAEEILRELMAGGPVEADRVAVLEADSESFSFVIKGWAAAATADADLRALKKAVEWLDFVSSLEDKEEGIKLPGETYRGILAAARACASQSPETLQVALDVFRKLMASHHPVDGLEYSRLLQCGILALSRPEQDDVRGQFLQDLFRNAAEAGLVNGPLLRTLANGAIFYDGWTADESWRWTRLLVGEWPLPPNWTRNIKQDGFLPIASDLRRTNFRQKGTHGSNPYGWK